MIDLDLGDIRHVPGWAEIVTDAIVEAQIRIVDDLQRLPVERDMNDLQAAIAQLIDTEYGWLTNSDQVMVCYGGVEALHVVMKLAAGDAGTISFLIPSFPYWKICNSADLSWSAIPIGTKSPSELVETILEQSNCTALIISQPHNPFGFVWDASDLQAIEKWALASGCRLILDTVAACTCDDRSWISGIDPECWWIVDSASKRFGVPGLRFGWVRKPRTQSTSIYLRFGVPVAISHAVSDISMKLLERAEALKCLIGRELHRRRKVTKEILYGYAHVPDGGVFVTIECQPPMNATHLVEKLAANGVKATSPNFLVPPTGFDALHDRYLRLSIGGETIERLAMGLKQVRSIVLR